MPADWEAYEVPAEVQHQQDYDDQRAADMANRAGLECHGQVCIEATEETTSGLAQIHRAVADQPYGG